MSDREHSDRRAGNTIPYTVETCAQLQLRAVNGTVWSTQAQAKVAELLDTSVPNILQTIRRVLDDGEVVEATTNSELMAQQEGERQARREVEVHNLNMIPTVGYRVTTETPQCREGSGRCRRASRSGGADETRARREETERGRDGSCQRT